MDYKLALRKGDARALLILQQESRGEKWVGWGSRGGVKRQRQRNGFDTVFYIESSDPVYNSFVGASHYNKNKDKYLLEMY